MTGKYKSGVKVAAKEAAVTKVQIAAAFARQMNASLENHAKSLQDLATQSEVPKELCTPIQDFFANVMQASDQYKPNLKQLTTKILKKTLVLKSAVENLQGLTTKQINQPTTGERKLIPVLRQLMSDVDHFIPHALYPRDLAHNFVLAHPSCNRSKSDTLAAKSHLLRWLEFVQTNADNLSQIGYDAGIMADEGSMDSVARWGYANAVAGGGQGWVKPDQYEPIDDSYLKAWA